MDVVIVATPGIDVDGYAALVAALRAEGADPDLVALPCTGDARSLSELVARRLRERPSPPVVVAHGVGATLALLSGAEAERWVLLGPVLDVSPVAAASDLARLPVGPAVDLDRALPWRDHPDVRHVLLGERLPALGCFPGGLARDLQRWLGEDAPPIAYGAVRAPVWVGLGLLDELAPPEVAVPLARRFADVEISRLGIAGLDPRDYDHAALLLDPVPLRAAARAAVGR